jgi:phage baseplate assembly protein W
VSTDDFFEDEFPPDPQSEDDFVVSPEEDLAQAIVPIFDDQLLDPAYPEVYDEYGAIRQYRAEVADTIKPIGRTWEFNFATGEFAAAKSGTPRQLKNNDARVIQQWIRRALTTERFSYSIYPQDFGVELDPIFSNSLTGPAGTAHIITTVTEALLRHDRIVNVRNVQVTEEDSTIYIRAEVLIEQGELVPINVPLGGV